MHPEPHRAGVLASASFEDRHSKVHPDVLRIRMLRELVMLKHHKEGRNLLNSYIKYRMEMARMESWSKFLQHCKMLSVVPTRFRLKNFQMKKSEFLVRILDRYSNQIMRADMRLIRKRTTQLSRIIAEKVQRMRLLFGEQLLREALEVTDKAYRRRMSIMDSEHEKELSYLNQRSGPVRVERLSRRGRPQELGLGAFRTRDRLRERSDARRFAPRLASLQGQQANMAICEPSCSGGRQKERDPGSGHSIEEITTKSSGAESCRATSAPRGDLPAVVGQVDVSSVANPQPTEQPEKEHLEEAVEADLKLEIAKSQDIENQQSQEQRPGVPPTEAVLDEKFRTTDPPSEELDSNDRKSKQARNENYPQGTTVQKESVRGETLAQYETLVTRLQNILERGNQLSEVDQKDDRSVLAPTSPKADEHHPSIIVCSHSCNNKGNDVNFVETSVRLVWQIFFGIGEYILSFFMPAN